MVYFEIIELNLIIQVLLYCLHIKYDWNIITGNEYNIFLYRNFQFDHLLFFFF